MSPSPYFHLTFPTLGSCNQPNKVSYLLAALDPRIKQREVLQLHRQVAKPHERKLTLDRGHLSVTVCNSVTAILSPRVLPKLHQPSPLDPPAWEAAHSTLTGWPRLLLHRENRGDQERTPSPSCLPTYNSIQVHHPSCLPPAPGKGAPLLSLLEPTPPPAPDSSPPPSS